MITKVRDLTNNILRTEDFRGTINRWIQDGNFRYSKRGHFNSPLPEELRNVFHEIKVNIDGVDRYIKSVQGDGTEYYSVELTEVVPMGRVYKISPVFYDGSGIIFSNAAQADLKQDYQIDLTDMGTLSSINFSDFPEYTIWMEDLWGEGHGWTGAYAYDGRSYIRGDLGENSYSPYLDFSEYENCEGRLRYQIAASSMDNSDEHVYLYVRKYDDSGWVNFRTQNSGTSTLNSNFTGYFSPNVRFRHLMSSRCQSGDYGYLYWIKVTVQRNNFSKLLFSFDERQTWVYHDSTSLTWKNCSLDDIQTYGMDNYYVENLTTDDYFHPLAFREGVKTLDISMYFDMPTLGAYPFNTITINGSEIIELKRLKKYRSVGFYNDTILSDKITKIY